eukprot:TRINITY_DN7901_c0_g1_i11.p1 TRINITY_DN7901_c0_g1~~TRINITY_DN7901_c0_g1_i11.p1  ORF type:complete len:230 (-),score=49.83 TRINITY_DN7901_c0_g1_i11:200-889(-)
MCIRDRYQRRVHGMAEIIGELLKVSSSPNGLHVAKKLISLTSKAEYEKHRVKIAETLAKNAIEIAQNPYGNYALQLVIDTYPTSITSKIIEVIKGKVVSLSVTRYSSNVVERCVEKAEEGLRDEVVKELMNSGSLMWIMKNRFGSFVVQKALAFASPSLRAEFKERLQSIIPPVSKKSKAAATKGSESNLLGLDFSDQYLCVLSSLRSPLSNNTNLLFLGIFSVAIKLI